MRTTTDHLTKHLTSEGNDQTDYQQNNSIRSPPMTHSPHIDDADAAVYGEGGRDVLVNLGEG